MHRHIQLLGATPLAQTVNILFANSDLSYGPSPQSFCTVQGLSQYSFIFGSSYTQPFEDARSLALLRVLASYTRNTRSSLYQSLILTAGGFTYIVHTESLSCLQTKQLPPHPVVCWKTAIITRTVTRTAIIIFRIKTDKPIKYISQNNFHNESNLPKWPMNWLRYPYSDNDFFFWLREPLLLLLLL